MLIVKVICLFIHRQTVTLNKDYYKSIMTGQVKQVPAPLCRQILSEEVQKGPVPNSRASGLLSHDARTQQRKEIDDC